MKINKKLLFLIFLILLETIIIKVAIYRILPDKFFYDANGILNFIKNGYIFIDNSRLFTVNFFKFINVFGFSTLKEWGYFISLIFTIITIYLISKYKNFNNIESVFILSSVALLNIFVYTIGKDIIQFLIFLFIFIILKNEQYTNSKKILLISILLILESIFFRVYYLIMAVLIITIYIIYVMFIKNKNLNKKSLIKIIFLGIFAFFIEVAVLKVVSTDNYNSIMYARSSVNVTRIDSVDAKSMIIDIFGINDSFYIFIENYIVNFFRMLFPIELIFKSIKYVPFIIYQTTITLIIIKCCKKINNQNILWITTIISFIMVSVLFEPDFGSFIRHESSLFLILIELFKISSTNEKEIPNGQLLCKEDST